MKKQIYSHIPLTALAAEFLLLIHLVEALYSVLASDSPSLLGASLYGFFSLIACVMIYFTDVVKICVRDGSHLVVCKRPFPFLFPQEIELELPVEFWVEQRPAGRESLVRIYVSDGRSSFPLTRARVVAPSKARNIVEELQASL